MAQFIDPLLERPQDPQKALFFVSDPDDKIIKGIACSVKTDSKEVFLVTCTDVAYPDGKGLVADRVCRLYPKQLKKHREKIKDIHNDDKFSCHSLPRAFYHTSLPYQLGKSVEDSCFSLAVNKGNTKLKKQINWSYDDNCKRYKSDRSLGESEIIHGSPVLWKDGNTCKTFVVGVVGTDGESPLPIFFKEKEDPHKILGKKD